ncbi:hypothetical protein LJK88_15745 [Paenibacillus sp. P26]|nr:hypothetical protein LJK88_15745 [Paenibacillus sp. P26]
MTKAKVYRWLVPYLLLAVVTACSGGEKTAENTKDTDKAQPYKMGSDPVELFIVSASGDSVESFNDRFLDLVQSKFPNVKLTYLPWKKEGPSIQEMITAGQQIDMYYDSIGIFSTVQNYQLQMDMSDLIKKHNVDLGEP